MDDRRLEVFLTTVQSGSFSRASEQLHCSQSAVTQIMNNMEAELGCKLLQRRHNGITLTPEGEALMPLILEADRALRSLAMEARELDTRKKASIRIGTYSSVANSFLPQLIKEYQGLVPDVSFQIRIGSDHLNNWLINDVVDLILADEQHSKGARWFPLMEDPYCGVIPADLAVTTEGDVISQEEFFRLPFIMASNNNYETCMHQLPENRLNVVCDDDSTLVNMVSCGLGVALLPKLCIINPPENVRILQIEPEFHRIIGLATPSKLNSRIRNFVTFVLERMESEN